jgi:hypothetical protein
MCLFKKLFGRKRREAEATEEPWFNDVNIRTGKDGVQYADPLTGKKKKPLMDPVYNCVPGNGQDSNAITKSGV